MRFWQKSVVNTCLSSNKIKDLILRCQTGIQKKHFNKLQRWSNCFNDFLKFNCFLFRKENQRTLPFNVEIRNLPQPKTVFRGSSSENPIAFRWEKTAEHSCRQLLGVRFWDAAFSLPGSLHPLHLPSLRHVRHHVLGRLLRPPRHRPRKDCAPCHPLSRSCQYVQLHNVSTVFKRLDQNRRN